jgi:hypothetical protein
MKYPPKQVFKNHSRLFRKKQIPYARHKKRHPGTACLKPFEYCQIGLHFQIMKVNLIFIRQQHTVKTAFYLFSRIADQAGLLVKTDTAQRHGLFYREFHHYGLFTLRNVYFRIHNHSSSDIEYWAAG